ARRAQKSLPSQGGWQIFHTYFAGVDCVDPTSRIIRANGDRAFLGGPILRRSKPPLVRRQAIARKLNRLAFDHGLYAPLGQFLQLQAWRTSLAGVTQRPLAFCRGVSKTA